MFQYFPTQHWLISILLPLIISLFFLLQIFFQTAQTNYRLDLNGADSIRVLLYRLKRTDSLHISSRAANLILYSVGMTDTFTSASVEGAHYMDSGNLKYQHKRTVARIESLVLLSDSSSTRMITDEHGYRYYSGHLRFKRGISIVNSIDLETDIVSLVGSEMDFENSESLKTQAVVSRTYPGFLTKKFFPQQGEGKLAAETYLSTLSKPF